jgi:hypothetical protein
MTGAILVFHYASFNGDAQARVANAYYVLFSRDPHVAAVGFVWNPLPSFTVLPLLPLKVLWPALTTRAFAGNIMSAFFMAAAGYQIFEFCRDLGLRWSLRLGLLAVFALNPMIVYYAANGMSEGLFIFTLVLAARYLAKWLRDDRTPPLVIAALALSVSYLARNEAVFAALFAASVVLTVAFIRTAGTSRERVNKALMDTFVIGLPFAASFVTWATVSWIITGHPFEQFSSIYGNSSQLRVINETAGSLAPAQALRRGLEATTSLAPTLPVVAAVALVLSTRRRDPRVLATLAVPGGVLFFAVAAYALGKTAGWFRYFITAVPLLVMLAASVASCVVVASHEPGRPRKAAVVVPRWLRRSYLASVAVAIVAIVATSVPTTGWAMLRSSVATEEHLHLGYIVSPKPSDPTQIAERHRLDSTIKMADVLDSMKLPHGAVLVDNFSPCVPFIILDSRRPQQFVIPNDEDFQRSLADPATFHVQYLMVPPGGGYGSLDAVNRQYPSLYGAGAGIAKLVTEFDLPGCPQFRLYKMNSTN